MYALRNALVLGAVDEGERAVGHGIDRGNRVDQGAKDDLFGHVKAGVGFPAYYELNSCLHILNGGFRYFLR